MMLRHHAFGRVRWKAPIPCHTRTNWEFYAVLEGQCALRLSEEEEWVPHVRTLWLFAPECSHGWANIDDKPFVRAALHFNSVPDPLGEMARRRGGVLQRPLVAAEVERVRGIAEELGPHFHAPTRVSHIHYQRALMELALLLLDGVEMADVPPTLSDVSEMRVERALSWYAERLEQNPTVEQVAAAIHVSPSHLRRLFAVTRDTSPKAAFQRVRLERAMQLMGASTLTLEEVAKRCGYASASHLCREHKAVFHFTPTTWRKRLVDRFVDPPEPGVVRMQDCNVRPRETAVTR
ncbi:MAG TPA: AraC family transcriptional regulator [Opitutaceae bacterium]|nr:AraC family transcriptional regulator [Opitutaceae bacterium]